MQRDFTNAILWYRKAIELSPQDAIPFQFIGQARLAMGDYTNALNNLEQSDLLGGGNEASTRRRYEDARRALAKGGIAGYWQLEWARTVTDTNSDFYRKAAIQLHLGHTNDAFYWLNRSYETHECQGLSLPLNYLLFDADWDGVHDDPRFRKLLDEVGFTKVMPPRGH